MRRNTWAKSGPREQHDVLFQELKTGNTPVMAPTTKRYGIEPWLTSEDKKLRHRAITVQRTRPSPAYRRLAGRQRVQRAERCSQSAESRQWNFLQTSGKLWNDPPRKDNSSWRSQQPSYSHSKSYHQQTSHDHSHHSYRQAARLSAAPQLDSKPLTAFSTSHQQYQKSKKRQPRSDTGYQSRGSSSIPAGHIQISLKDDHKKE